MIGSLVKIGASIYLAVPAIRRSWSSGISGITNLSILSRSLLDIFCDMWCTLSWQFVKVCRDLVVIDGIRWLHWSSQFADFTVISGEDHKNVCWLGMWRSFNKVDLTIMIICFYNTHFIYFSELRISSFQFWQSIQKNFSSNFSCLLFIHSSRYHIYLDAKNFVLFRYIIPWVLVWGSGSGFGVLSSSLLQYSMIQDCNKFPAGVSGALRAGGGACILNGIRLLAL